METKYFTKEDIEDLKLSFASVSGLVGRVEVAETYNEELYKLKPEEVKQELINAGIEYPENIEVEYQEDSILFTTK